MIAERKKMDFRRINESTILQEGDCIEVYIPAETDFFCMLK